MQKVFYHIICFVLVVSGSFEAIGQINIRFVEEAHDFGTIKEKDGEVSFRFFFVNEGKEAIKIENVETSCGCTTPDWSQTLVNPSDTGYLLASFSPLNRPGNFDKTLKVEFISEGGLKLIQNLSILGEVIPKPRTIRDEFPAVIGGLRLKYKSLNFGRISTEKTITKAFEVYNDSDSTIIWLVDSVSTGNHLMVELVPDTLRSNEIGEIIVSFDPIKKSDLGYVSDNLKLYTNEWSESEKELRVIATISEHFPSMTDEELSKAPKLSFDKSQHSFGVVAQGSTVVTQFELTNSGLEKLSIRQVKTNCGCVVVQLQNTEIDPGRSIKMQVSFDSSGRQGRQYKTVTVFSNDPAAPTQMVTVKAEITE